MKYFYKVFLWKNGQKSTDYTQYLTVPIFIEDRLNEQLASGEIILDLMPLSSKSDFPPKTKFVIERYKQSDFSDIPKIWQMVVDHDDVEEYGSVPNTCCHRITLIEPSAIAQGIHVDNIALTYELQDVDLNYVTVVPESETISDQNLLIVSEGASNGWTTPVHSNPTMSLGTVHFLNSFRYEWYGTESLGNIIYRFDGRTSQTINFTIPTLMCQGVLTEDGVFQDLVEVATKTTITKKHYNAEGVVLDESVELEATICGPSDLTNVKNDTYFVDEGQVIGGGTPQKIAYVTRIEPFQSSVSGVLVSIDGLDQFSDHIWQDSTWPIEIVRANNNYSSKNIVFNTQTLTAEQINNNEYLVYEILCTADSSQLPVYYDADCDVWETTGPAGYANSTGSDYGSVQYISGSNVKVQASFSVQDLSQNADYGPYIREGSKYSAYDLIQKTLLTCDTQIIDNEQNGLDDINYFITIADEKLGSSDISIIDKLETTQVSETIFENKNLWEVLLQVGYYLHAIPYLKFADDGTDRFALSFKLLGDTVKKADTNNKITIYNSKNLNEYYSELDSYVTNLYSPQNEVEEWLVPKSTDGSYIISNNNASLVVKYPITEVIEFKVLYNNQTRDILDYIFEESIYSVLLGYLHDENGYRITPSKGAALYYTMGTTEIKGLFYMPPSQNDGDEFFALKNIIMLAYGLNELDAANIKFNDLKFYIKYRTQDSMRITQFRPDLKKFLKNSSYEKYPKHSQFYGQQEKIIDSERFSANLFGQLVRVGNDVYQMQEYVMNDADEKACGDLVEIYDDTFYVTEVENEMYPDATLQKVTYSKDYNQLSQIVTIPSEPRFYEVSERSKVRREVRLIEFLELSNSNQVEIAEAPRYLNQNDWKVIVKSLLFNDGEINIPNYAYTSFVGDKFRHNEDVYNMLFPSSDVIRASDNTIVPVDSSNHIDCIVPLLHFPLRNGLVFEWDMDDNFKVGDFVDLTTASKANTNVDEAYYGMRSLRYCDIYGRADLFRFKLFYKQEWSFEQSQALPKAVLEPDEVDCFAYVPNSKLIALDKDNREEISFNFQIALLYNGDIVTFSNLFGEKNSKLICCLLNKEVGKFSEIAGINNETLIVDNVPYTLQENNAKNVLEINFTQLSNVDMSEVKSIVFYDVNGNDKIAYIAKNVANVPNTEKLQSLAIYPVFND